MRWSSLSARQKKSWLAAVWNRDPFHGAEAGGGPHLKIKLATSVSTTSLAVAIGGEINVASGSLRIQSSGCSDLNGQVLSRLTSMVGLPR